MTLKGRSWWGEVRPDPLDSHAFLVTVALILQLHETSIGEQRFSILLIIRLELPWISAVPWSYLLSPR